MTQVEGKLAASDAQKKTLCRCILRRQFFELQFVVVVMSPALVALTEVLGAHEIVSYAVQARLVVSLEYFDTSTHCRSLLLASEDCRCGNTIVLLDSKFS